MDDRAIAGSRRPPRETHHPSPVTRHSSGSDSTRRQACQGASRRTYSRVESAVGQSSRPVAGRFPWSSPIDAARNPARHTLLNCGRSYRSTLNRPVPPVQSPARDCVDPRALPVLRHAAPDAQADEDRGGSERRCARGKVQAGCQPGQRQLLKYREGGRSEEREVGKHSQSGQTKLVSVCNNEANRSLFLILSF